MKYFSMFSGIGGFEIPLQKLGHTCIGYSEIDKYACQIYDKHFNHKNYGDCTTINAKDLPDFDLLVGGFPCQAFSIAGKRKGFDDTRGTLFFDIARIVREKQPRLLLLENVKGLLSHDKGNTFRVIISTLDELGYDCQWQVLNSKNFGVPQNRERVFIIGHLRGTSRPEVFPIGGSSEWVNKSQEKTQGKGQRIRGEIASTLAQRDYKGGNNLIQLNQPKHSNDRVYGADGLSPTLNTMQGGNRQPFIPDEAKIRRLTPTECERLQGFPEIEKYDKIEVCKTSNANGVEFGFNTKSSDNVAQSDVLIDCVENGVEIRSQEKLLLNAKGAEKKNWSHPLIKIDDFVQLLVGINIIKEKIIRRGEGESHQNERCLTPQKNGKKQGNKYGNEIMQPVESAENDLTTLKELLKFTTLSHSNIESLEQKLIILYSFVTRAIIGFIPEEILNQDTFTIGVKTKVGFTYGLSDTQRYKTLGNAVTVNVIEYLASKLIKN